jgi:N-acetylglucosamine kinase-like BadF-type ATPase
MEYVIGIDGGGTKTLLKIGDMTGRLLGTYEGGPCNLNSKGADFVQKMLKELILNSVEENNLQFEDCRGICIGTAGAGRETEKRIIENIIRATGYGGELIITDDAVTALYGGTGKGEGIILISGTGSICYGITSSGEKYRVGGWGHVIGDEGSAYQIAVKILNTVMKSYDGREKDTVLTEVVLKKLQLPKVEALIEYVYRSGNGKNEIAALAEIISEACDKGDKAALRIASETVEELFNHVKVVVEKLKLGDKETNLVTNGSVINKNLYISSQFKKLVFTEYPLIQIIQMKDDAAAGALRIVLDRLLNMSNR